VVPVKVTIVVEAAVPDGVRVVGLKEQIDPEGKPEQAKLTAELKPFVAMPEIVADAA
jgi:hypothetical protein